MEEKTFLRMNGMKQDLLKPWNNNNETDKNYFLVNKIFTPSLHDGILPEAWQKFYTFVAQYAMESASHLLLKVGRVCLRVCLYVVRVLRSLTLFAGPDYPRTVPT